MTLAWTLPLIGIGSLGGWYLWERSHRITHPMEGGLHEDLSIPYTDEFELYHNALSLCSKKARICFDELGVPYKSHHIDLIETGSYENIGRAFLAVNPSGILPVLVHNGHPIYESHDIIRYAAEHAGNKKNPLIPSDPAKAREMDEWVDKASLKGDDPMAGMKASAGNTVPALTVPMFASMIEDIPTTRILEGLLFHRLKIRPLMFLMLQRTKLKGLPQQDRMRSIIKQGVNHMRDHLRDLEQQLISSGGPWIVGDQYTLADVSWAVIFARLEEGDYLDFFLEAEARPHVTRYWQAIAARPSYETAIRAHTHPTMVKGLERLRKAKAASPQLREAIEGR